MNNVRFQKLMQALIQSEIPKINSFYDQIIRYIELNNVQSLSIRQEVQSFLIDYYNMYKAYCTIIKKTFNKSADTSLTKEQVNEIKNYISVLLSNECTTNIDEVKNILKRRQEELHQRQLELQPRQQELNKQRVNEYLPLLTLNQQLDRREILDLNPSCEELADYNQGYNRMCFN